MEIKEVWKELEEAERIFGANNSYRTFTLAFLDLNKRLQKLEGKQ